MAAATDLGTALQARIYAILTADATLSTLTGGSAKVYDHVSDKHAFPHIVIGEDDVDAFLTKVSDPLQGSTEIRVWTQSQTKVGRKECKDIMSRIWTLLHRQDLAVPDRVQIGFYCASQRMLVEEDGRTYQGIMTFNFIFGGNDT